MQQNKICMIRIKTQKVLHNWGNIFYMATSFGSIKSQEPYLKLNQKSMVDPFCKNS